MVEFGLCGRWFTLLLCFEGVAVAVRGVGRGAGLWPRLVRVATVLAVFAGVVAAPGISVAAPGDVNVAPVLPVAGFGPGAGAVSAGASVGYLPGGGVSVSDTGAVSSSVPLRVPDGPGGLQPSLSLSYSSRGGNGDLGVGWSVAGLSSITRCAKTVATEGERAGVSFRNGDDEDVTGDRFCLDGQKLVSSKDYGASDTEYRTELDGFDKIVSKESDGLGPQWFKVFMSGGTVREYRPKLVQRLSANASGVRAAGGQVRLVWLLSKESDRSGNVVEYAYRSDLADVEGVRNGSVSFQLDEISYSKVGGAARRSVKFAYELGVRADQEFSWSAGVSQHLSHRLSSIEMYGPNPQVTGLLWKYNLKYRPAEQSKRSLLASVQQCGALGTCTWLKTFKYNADKPVFSTPSVLESDLNLQRVNGQAPHAVQPGDFNGDGADDYVYQLRYHPYVDSRKDFVRLSKVNASGAVDPLQDRHQINSSLRGWNLLVGRPVDVDGDGTDELAAPVAVPGLPLTGSMDVLRWNAGGSKFEAGSSSGTFTSVSGLGDGADFADVDGDSRLDLVEVDKGTPDDPQPPEYSYKRNTGTAFEASGTKLMETFCQPMYADVDGNGRMEILAGSRGSSARGCASGDWAKASLTDEGELEAAVEPVDGTFPVPGYPGDIGEPAERQLAVGDFNGDGLQDAALVEWLGSPRIQIRLNTGSGYAPARLFSQLPAWPVGDMVPDGDGGDRGLRIADMDGDGRSDFVFFHEQAVGAMPVWNGPSSNSAGVTVLYAAGGFEDLPGVSNPTWMQDGLDLGVRGDFSLSQLGDFNRDGRTDLVTYRGDGTAGNSSLVLITNKAGASGAGQDVLTEVGDSANTLWPRVKISYSTKTTDQPASPAAVEFPLQNMRRQGLLVVRKVESFEHLLDPASQAAIDAGGRVTEYRYENPVMDVQGRGFLGFSRTWVWDAHRPRETVTTFDNTTRFGGPDQPHGYPFAGRPKTVLTATAKLTAADIAARPEKADVRVTRSETAWEQKFTYSTKAWVVRPVQRVLPNFNQETKEWEEPAAVDWNLDIAGNTASPRTHIFALDVPASPSRNIKRASEYDQFNNVTHAQSRTVDGTATDVVTSYDLASGRTSDWLIHLVSGVTTTKIEADDTPLVPHRGTSKTASEYDDLGRLKKTFTEKNATDTDLRETTTYQYLDGGQVKSVKHESDTAGTSARETRFEYTPLVAGWPDEKIYPTQQWAVRAEADLAKRPSTWTITHPGLGVALATVDANAVTASTRYDDLGRVLSSTQPGQGPVATSYAGRADTFGSAVTGVTVTTTRGQERSRTTTDALARTVASETRGFDGTPVVTVTGYDLLGRAVKQSRPYKVTSPSSAPGDFTRTVFDGLDRPVTITAPDDTVTAYDYPDMFTTTLTDAKHKASRTVTDKDGRTTSTVNVKAKTVSGTATDVTTQYKNGPFGVEKITSDEGHVTTQKFDARGRVTERVDPDTGTTTTKYNGFADIREQRNTSINRARTQTFDDLGRVIQITDVDGTTPGRNSRFTFDTATDSTGKPNGIGKLAEATSADAVTTRYRYDTAGRTKGTDYFDLDTNTTYSTDLTYDLVTGQIESTLYPAAGRTNRFTVKNVYNAYGHLTEIGDNTGGSGTYQRLWRADSRNADMSLAQATLGNDITTTQDYYPKTGQTKKITTTPAGTGTAAVMNVGYEYWPNGTVKRRNDLAANRDESYDYDAMGRLSEWTLTRPGITPVKTVYGYSPDGNLTTVTKDSTLTETNSYGLAGGTQQPHTLTAAATPGTTIYRYDAMGRQISGGRTLTYHGLSVLPATVTQGGQSSQLTYTADGTRFKKTTGTNITTYIGGLYEKRTNGTGSTATTSHVFHVPQAGQITWSGTSGRTVDYTLNDLIGSVSTTLTGTGTPTATKSYYQPFGRRINSDGTPYTAAPGRVTRGFTGQEHDTEYGLINMNGRLYDPT
ncbi:SpvB/TcaC N-terminal domain-containing protein, partial [Streptomyces sp. NPDC002306]